MAYDTALAQVKAQLNAFAEKIKQISKDAANAEYADNAGKLEGLTLTQVVELIAGTVGLTAQDVRDELHAFIARRDNPHEVTAEQVGLGEVANYGVATAEEMENGAAERYVTADIVKGALDAAISELESGIAGDLGNVMNYGIASVETDMGFFVENETTSFMDAAAASNELYVTPFFLVTTMKEWWARQLGSTPETLDTIAEIASALTENGDLIDDIATLVAGKATTEYVDDGLATKVDQTAYDTKIQELEDALAALENLEGLAISTDEQALETDIELASSEVLATPRSVLLQVNLARQEAEDQLVQFMEELATSIEDAADLLEDEEVVE